MTLPVYTKSISLEQISTEFNIPLTTQPASNSPEYLYSRSAAPYFYWSFSYPSGSPSSGNTTIFYSGSITNSNNSLANSVVYKVEGVPNDIVPTRDTYYFKGPLVSSSQSVVGSTLYITEEYKVARIYPSNISMSDCYSGGSYVPGSTLGYPGGVVTTIPSSGTISLANFYGSANRTKQLYTFTSNNTWIVPQGVTSARIIVVGGGGAGGGVTVAANDGYASGGGGGAGQVLDLDLELSVGYAISISIGAGALTSQSQGGTTNVSIPGYNTINAIGGYSGEKGTYANGVSIGGMGGLSGNGFSGWFPGEVMPGEAMGGGGGGAYGSGVNDQGGDGYTFTLGGTTFTKGVGGWGDLGSRNGPANSGNGGGGAVASTKFNVNGPYSGGSGVVYIYG